MLALWCAHTHVYIVFQCSPRIHVSAPTHDCGKTTVRDCAEQFCAKAKSIDNMTEASLFRLVSRHHPTILVDECDKWAFKNEELVGLFNSGHRKGGTVVRCVGEDFELREFGVYTPTLLAAIGTLPDQLHSRSIVVRLERATRAESKALAKFNGDHVEYERDLNCKLARWITDNRDRIEACEPKLPENLFNRIGDNWRPLFAIAEIAGGDWPQRCANALIKLTTREDDTESLRVMLLADIYKIFTGLWPLPPDDDQDPVPIDKAFSETLVDFLGEMKDRPWPEVCRGGKPITERWLARNLAVFGIHSKSMRIAEGNQKGYARADFDEAFRRYLDICDVPNVTRNDAVTDAETEISICKNDECDAVTAKTPKKLPHTEFFPKGTFTL